MNGWIKNTNAEYHSGPEVGNSFLKTMLVKSPAHAMAPSKEATDAMIFGTRVHQIVLEPDTCKWAIPPKDLSMATKEGKEWKLLNGDKEIVSIEDYTNLTNIATRLKDNPLLKGGVAEVSGYVTDDAGVQRRIRPDYRTDDFITDIKTTDDVSDRGIEKALFGDFLYPLQGAWYVDTAYLIDGLPRDFYWVFVEKKYPWAVRNVQMTGEILEIGRRQYMQALEIYLQCLAHDEFPSYSEEILQPKVPAWYKY